MANKKEIRDLTRRFGPFEHARIEYAALSPGFGEWVRKLTRRRGEVVLVVPREAGRILLHTKPHYPENVFRLPTGGIAPAEDAADAAQRETYEEIGFDSRELKLLGVLDNVFQLDKKTFVYPSFIFQTEGFLRQPSPTDPNEAISGFRDVDPLELRATALYLASLPGRWREWGKFRSAPHAWLAERLMR